MQVNGVAIQDTFAEAFTMYGTRIMITAVNEKWAREAALAATGFATSVIGCGIEAGIEGQSAHTPDGRYGLDCLFFGMSKEDLLKQLIKRAGQAIMTAPTTACYDGGLSDQERINEVVGEKLDIGGKIRFFGDGYQASKVIEEQRYWRIPVMEGEFVIQETFSVVKGVGGGNFLILGQSEAAVLAAAEAAVQAIKQVKGVILPFPGGIVRSGSKVGSRYKFASASTNTDYCPTIRGRVRGSCLSPKVNSVLEIVIDGLTFAAVGKAMRVGIQAACLPGIEEITAGNYGGRLGKHHFHLKEIIQDENRRNIEQTGSAI
ncbi:formylmethanofuran--tetrahydromethanopterin N-formyltransferase [Sporomusa sphaeroides DSM 2875]|uniref:formylmethanofuran--tetrahydromethanopterin N-formyltransferase n=1 Tax=Sporomusa sphaeroides TaxID=47679 RepID=UPI002030CB25|nr:formylmethanofuran--tetrahydromethanopterin N-formyltransferase [Sporomusa sphaeroides]MCM0759197.1 formylmethanofuran--tetrahydromethanopterin N-formyltransferase [Sporomusa sphaeroides DSM 2875]